MEASSPLLAVPFSLRPAYGLPVSFASDLPATVVSATATAPCLQEKLIK
jgi:hypothetical protein